MTPPKLFLSFTKPLAVCALVLALGCSAHAAIYPVAGPFADNGAGPGVIPDNSTIGLSDAQTLSGLGPSVLDAVLTVHLSGSFIGDLSGYLRLGNTEAAPMVSLDAWLTPGDRDFTVNLPSFQGLNPNDTWTLFFADKSAGGQDRLSGWSLELSTVPEPLNQALGLFGLILAGAAGVSAIRRCPQEARRRREQS